MRKIVMALTLCAFALTFAHSNKGHEFAMGKKTTTTSNTTLVASNAVAGHGSTW